MIVMWEVILARQLLLPRSNEWSRGRHKKLFSAPPHAQRSGGGLREGINSSGGMVANTVCYDDGGTGRWLAHFRSPETQTAELSTGHDGRSVTIRFVLTRHTKCVQGPRP